jgi:cytochrome c peroxidase
MSKKGDFEAVRKDIAKLMHQPEYDDGSAGPVLVRLAWYVSSLLLIHSDNQWICSRSRPLHSCHHTNHFNRHSSGTYDAETDTGGSNGAGMRYEAEGGDPANAGLQHARVFLEPVKEKHSWITYADLWTLAGAVAIKEMGGPEIPWKGGRTDFVDDSKLPPRGRLPDGAQGADHLRWIFYRMGFNDQEIVALSGAHNLGRCHSDRSGFEGAWVNNPTRFSNQYFRLLLSLQWKKKTLKNGIEQFVNYDEDTETELMMLPTDIALTQDPKFRKYVELYARDKDRFFEDFSKVFHKLLELGIQRNEKGEVINTDNEKGGYHAAPKKKPTAGSPAKSTDDKRGPSEAEPLKEENTQFRARL